MSELNDTIKKAAEQGYKAYVKQSEEADLPKWDALESLHKMGLYSMVSSIIANPLTEPYASLMPGNHDRKAFRALDDCLRDALGYARFNHA